ncbi:MAG: DMT family transporter [Eubacterium sp.]|nr:DMT family transporter [Eubacterium sp.]
MKKNKNTILLFIPPIVWGFSFVAQTVAIGTNIGSMTFNMAKYILGTLSLVPVLLIFDRKDNRNFKKESFKPLIMYGVLAGVILFFAAWTQQYGMELGVKLNVKNITGLAGFITAIYMLIVPFIRFLGGKKTNIETLIGAVFAIVGLYLLCVTDGFGSLTVSHLFLFICAVIFAFHIIVIDKYSVNFSPIKFSMVQFATVALLSTVCAFIFEKPSISQITAAGLPLLYSGIGSVGIAYTFQTISQKNADPTFAGIVFSTESVFSAVGGALILHEIMTARGYIGCVIIFAGILLAQIDFKKLKMNKA